MGAKTKVVMIDDELDLCLVVKGNLEDTGQFEVVTSTAPEEAEALINKEKPDIILLDVVMPKRQGTDIVASLRKHEETKKIPIILVSGKGEMVYNKKKNEFRWMPNNPMARGRGDLPEGRGAEALAQAYGVDDYISKPFTTEILTQVITDVLARKPRKQPEAETA